MTDRRVAVITGGNSGIGEAVGRRFVREGIALAIVTDQPEEAYEPLCRELEANGAVVLGCRCDIRDRAAVNAMMQTVIGRFGGIDICINSAGVAIPDPFDASDPAVFDIMAAVNIVGTYNVLRAAISAMRIRGGGVIVNIASAAGILGVHGMVGYSATKAAIIAMTKALPGELRGQNIRINAIAPAAVATAMTANIQAPQTDFDRLALRHVKSLTPAPDGNPILQPEAIADMAMFLISDAALGMTGSVLMADNGLTSAMSLFPQPE